MLDAVDRRITTLIERRETPGLQYLVTGREGVLLERCAGRADVAAGLPVTPETWMPAFSMTKAVTAAVVLALVDDGRLGLDERAADFIEGFPYPGAVTTRRLLSQSSGLPDPIPLRWVRLPEEACDERAELAAVLKRHPKPAFAPGERYGYSNIGYWALGAMVERASGRPFAEFVRERVLEPLGIGPAELGFRPPETRSLAKGYLAKWSFLNIFKGLVTDAKFWGAYEESWLEIRPALVFGPAFGGLLGTARGFGRFLADFLGPRSKVLSERSRALYFEVQKDSRGRDLPMTLGWHLGDLDGERFFYKEGGGAGFHSELRLYPGRGAGSVLLANDTTFAVRKRLSEMDREALLC